jgi:hypothetical protein
MKPARGVYEMEKRVESMKNHTKNFSLSPVSPFDVIKREQRATRSDVKVLCTLVSLVEFHRPYDPRHDVVYSVIFHPPERQPTKPLCLLIPRSLY